MTELTDKRHKTFHVEKLNYIAYVTVYLKKWTREETNAHPPGATKSPHNSPPAQTNAEWGKSHFDAIRT